MKGKTNKQWLNKNKEIAHKRLAVPKIAELKNSGNIYTKQNANGKTKWKSIL
jgi:hypothetical protein